MNTPTPPERFRRIARAVERLVEEDEELVIVATENGVAVCPAPKPLEQQHPRLYGRLLSLNAQMERSRLVFITAFILLGMFWLGLQVGWWEPLISKTVAEAINAWWAFFLLLILLITIVGGITDYQARRVYRRSRAELGALLREAGLDREILLVRIEGIAELRNVSHQLKLDPNPLP